MGDVGRLINANIPLVGIFVNELDVAEVCRTVQALAMERILLAKSSQCAFCLTDCVSAVKFRLGSYQHVAMRRAYSDNDCLAYQSRVTARGVA